jgi:DNA-binding GntR family transcriptional regulator
MADPAPPRASTGTSNAQLAHDVLRTAIVEGRIPQGAVLSQVRLAKELGVSRTPLREALRMLQAEGLIEAVHNRRVRVASFSVHDLEQLYAARITLETFALRLSVPQFSEADFDALREHLDEMDACAEAHDFVGWERPHRAFHQGLVMHSGSRIQTMLAQLADNLTSYRRLHVTESPPLWWRSADEHKRVLAGCERGDADLACAELARHLARTALTVIAVADLQHDPSSLRTALAIALASAGVVELSNLWPPPGAQTASESPEARPADASSSLRNEAISRGAPAPNAATSRPSQT